MKRDCGCQLQAGRLFLCSLHLTSASSPVTVNPARSNVADDAREELQAENARLRERIRLLEDEPCPDCNGDGHWGKAPDGRYRSCETCGGHEDRLGSGKLRAPMLDENARLREQAEALKAAILDIDAHSTAMGEDGDGFITGGYIVTVGSLHRALGAVGHTARKCSHEARCPTCAQADALAAAADLALRGRVINNWLTGGDTICLQCGQLPDSGQHDDGCWVAEMDAALRAYREATP